MSGREFLLTFAVIMFLIILTGGLIAMSRLMGIAP